MTIPKEWMPPVKMDRIICHWTAGGHRATDFDRKHYHILINGDGSVVRGHPSIAGNARGGAGLRANHTLNCNTGSIGVSLACMGGALEKPFDPGKSPMTKAQWDRMAEVVATLCRQYRIPVTPKTVLSHAEVQTNLGIAQRGKWDFTRLAFEPSLFGAKLCGDRLRRDVQARMRSPIRAGLAVGILGKLITAIINAIFRR